MQVKIWIVANCPAEFWNYANWISFSLLLTTLLIYPHNRNGKVQDEVDGMVYISAIVTSVGHWPNTFRRIIRKENEGTVREKDNENQRKNKRKPETL